MAAMMPFIPRHKRRFDTRTTICAGDDQSFLETITRIRRRAGATFWRVYRDLGEPSRYVERFIVTSWADYLRQRATDQKRWGPGAADSW
jgi:hypothetical protein